MVRRLILIAVVPLLLLSCRDNPRKALLAGPADPEESVVRPGQRDPRTGRYIPPACSADGSFEKALRCFRRAEVIRFRIPGGQGTITREGPARARMVLYVVGRYRGTWRAAKQSRGIGWSFNGGPPPPIPPEIARIFELVSTFPDPKRLGASPSLTAKDEKALTYEFADAKSGERFVVKVDARLGHIVEITAGELNLKIG